MIHNFSEKPPLILSSVPVQNHIQTSPTKNAVGNFPGVRQQHANSTSSSADVNSPHKQKRLRLQLAKERKASTTLGIIMSAFTICWLPFFILAWVRICLSDPEVIPSSLSSIFLWLGYCNSLLNPIIYATLNRDFRKPFREILFFRCGNLQHMMREEFYQSQYGDPVNNYNRSGNETSEVLVAHQTRIDSQGVESIDVSAINNPPGESFL